jgi:tetratricopeptide (TPR) repeat protein
VYIKRNQFDVAERHCHRCLVISIRLRVEGEDKITSIFEALSVYVNLRQRQGDFSSAVLFAEEAYNLVVDVFDPGHPQVQEAAGWLINCLIQKCDLFNAERFAEQTYANLRDTKNGMDYKGEIVAEGAHNLADVICRQEDGDLIKAEGLAREAIRIIDKLFGSDDSRVAGSYLLLARILQKQGKFGDETKEFYERSLAIHIRTQGQNGSNIAISNFAIGRFYHQFAITSSAGRTKKKSCY